MSAVIATACAADTAVLRRAIGLAARVLGAATAAVLERETGGGWRLVEGLGDAETLRTLLQAAPAVPEAGVLTVADLAADPQWAASATACGGGSPRFLALAPLEAGKAILAVADAAPRPVDAIDEPALALCDIAALVRQGRGAAVASAASLTSEKLHKAVLDAAVDAIVTIDGRGVIRSVNPAALTMFGYDRDDLLGRKVDALMPPADAGRHDDYMRNYAETGRAKIIGSGRQLMARRRDGSEFPVELTLSEVNLPGERLYTGILRDVSRRAEAERRLRVSEERLQRSQVFANIGSWEWNIVSGDLYWSDRIGPLFGYPPGELETSYDNFVTAIHPDDRDAVLRAVDACVTGGADYDVEHRVVWPDGTVRWLQEKGDVVRDEDGRALRMLGVVQDITRIKEAEAGHRRARQDADAANSAKSEFLSSMSHELRTPLNAILGFAQLLEGDTKPALSERQLDHVRHIRKGGTHLLNLINEVLDLARIEAGKMTLSLESFVPDGVLDECLSIAATLAEGRRLRVIDGRSGDLPAVTADYTRLKQVLLNLLSNAVKYNREGGMVTVSAMPVDSVLRIAVSDTGYGIPGDRLGEIFEPFNRLGAEATEVEGTGIGLTLTRTLIEGMGGAIGVTSTPAIGSTFWVDIPMSAEQPPPTPAPLAEVRPAESRLVEPQRLAPGDGRTHLVLYVEDNPANLRLMEEICADLTDIALISAHNAELGLDLAREQQPALILMDINLPGMDGLQAMARLRADPRTQHIPVIALSANAMQAAVRRAREAGFAAYLTKPVVIEDLRAAIWKVLEGCPA
ncbi:PAS domain S-box protein [Novispirillum sp. DQ9]|uniref:PAS domain S-box protein n=1 Tax=Novispirillum sp. DQ9 TaxID=3398612 RepID=UPI003C7E0B06